MALEPLAVAIRADVDISGVAFAGVQHKANFFANDALLVLTNPFISLPNLQLTFNHFSAFLGLGVNPFKIDSTERYPSYRGRGTPSTKLFVPLGTSLA